MNLQQRIDLLIKLGTYLKSDDERWNDVITQASQKNGWFTVKFIRLASENIADRFLSSSALTEWAKKYELGTLTVKQKTVGIVTAGNIPLVGMHDIISVFLAGHRCMLKLSSKDEILIAHLLDKLKSWNSDADNLFTISDLLKNCDAYIATGSNNTSRYFQYYFKKYPHIIRRNRTSVAILDGSETEEELDRLADDVHMYFGLGCRNVTKLYVPSNYDFIPLLKALKKYIEFADHHKYKNNYDYNLAIHILNNRFYMTNGSVILAEDPSIFSPISQLNYEFYSSKADLEKSLSNNDSVQCVIGHGYTGFGHAQCPDWDDFADGVDTMQFLVNLGKT